jgi:hypothetical protein
VDARLLLPRRMPAARRSPAALAAVSAAAVLLTGCALPGVPIDLPPVAEPLPSGGAAIDPLEAIDGGSAALRAQLDLVAARVYDVRLLFEAAGALDMTDPGARAELSSISQRIIVLLLGSAASDAVADGDTDGDGGAGLLPAIAADRSALGSDDLITRTVTLAGDVGGERSRLVLELVRDPLVGDLGAWQRDPLGVIALVRAAAADATDVASLDAALLELPGELTRALGYAFVLAERTEPDLLEHAAASGAARLRVVLIALTLADEALTPEGTP